jgi:phosphatidylglycerol lysyltransferase
VTLAVTVGVLVLVVVVRVATAEPDFPHHPPVAALALVALVAGTWTAERAIGAVRTVIVAMIVPTLAVLGSALAVQIGAAAGEAHAEDAVGQPFLAPSVVAAALFAAATAAMPTERRWRVRTTLWTVVLALLLFAGHGSDLARALATLLGIAGGVLVVPRASRPVARDVVTARTVVVAVLSALGAGTLVTVVVPEPDGVLSPFASALSTQGTVVAGALLLVAAWLVHRARPSGVVLASIVLFVLTAVLADAFVIEPLQASAVQWHGLGLDEVEWQVTLLGAWVVPASVLLGIAAVRGRLVRSRFQAATGSDVTLAERLRAGDAGTLGHMGTWHGNAAWVHPDGLGAVAFRVCGDVALAVSDPACAAADRRTVLTAFAAHCERQGWVPAFTSVHGAVRDVLGAEGWTALPVGVEAVIDLTGFDLRGKRRQDLRTACNRAQREGVRDEWTTLCGLSPEHRVQVETICTTWAADRRLPEMGFTLGGFRELDDPDVRLMLAVDADDRVTAVTSWLPVYEHGELTGYTLDVMRRGEDVMPGVVEFLVARTAIRSREAGLTTVSLSGTPLAAHDPDARTVLDRGTSLVARLLEPVYGFRSLQRFKEKFGARHEPLWLLVPTPLHVPRVARALARAYVPGLRPAHLIHLGRAHRTRPDQAAVGAGRS